MHRAYPHAAPGQRLSFLLTLALTLCIALGVGGLATTPALALSLRDDISGYLTERQNNSSMYSSEPDQMIQERMSQEEIDLVNSVVTNDETLVRSGMSLRSSQEQLDYYSVYTDAPFRQPATTYNPILASMSITMATCANRPIPYSSNISLVPDQFLVQYLQDSGFTDLREDDYDKTPSIYTVATAMGRKTLLDENGEPFTLIAVGVCGGNYKKEWLSNVTLGTGIRHQGFDSAARAVTDRIFGYLGTRHITGRVKIWICGFSRAAAVSNLTAANLVDSGVAAKEDIFAYTFATPRTSREGRSEGYENIFNIVGPMDMIPQVAPAAWGFERYGVDLTLPGMETDSQFSSKYELVQSGFNDMYESVTNYNPKVNLCLRLLIGMFEELVSCQDEYDVDAQSTILSILEDRSPQNVLRVLRLVTLKSKDSTPEQRALQDEMVEFIGRFATGAIFESSDIFDGHNSGSVTSRVFHEHIEDLYLMWMDLGLDYDQLFGSPNTFTYLFLIDGVKYTIEDASTGEALYSIDENGTFERLQAAIDRDLVLANGTFDNVSYDYNATFVALPHDADYRVTWEAVSEDSPIAWIVPTDTRVAPSYEVSTFFLKDTTITPGDTGVIYEAHGDQVDMGNKVMEYYDSSLITLILGLGQIENGWRMTIMTLVMRICLGLIFLRAIVATINRWGTDDTWQFRFIASSIVMFALVESEIAYWLFAAKPQYRLIWKAIAGAGVILYCLCCRKSGSRDFWRLFLALVICIAGDLAINFWFLPGLVLFALAHIILIWFFQTKRRLPKRMLVWWVLMSLAIAPAAYILSEDFITPIRVGVAVYATILLLVLFTGRQQGGNLALGSFLFVLSDALLGFYFLHQEYPYAHMAYMALYYLALLIMCRSLIDEEVFVTKDGWIQRMFEGMRHQLELDKDDETPSQLGETARQLGDVIVD